MGLVTQRVVNIILKGLKEKQDASEKAVKLLSKHVDEGKINTAEAKEILDMLGMHDANTKEEIEAVKKLSKL